MCIIQYSCCLVHNNTINVRDKKINFTWLNLLPWLTFASMCLFFTIISLSNADNASDLLRIIVTLTLLVLVTLYSSPYGQSKNCKSCLISLIIYIYLLVYYWQLNSPIHDNLFDIELQNISFIYTLFISAFISVYFAGVAAGAAESRVILLAMRCHDYILQIRALYQGPGIRTETLNKLKLRLTQKSEHRLCLGFVLDN